MLNLYADHDLLALRRVFSAARWKILGLKATATLTFLTVLVVDIFSFISLRVSLCTCVCVCVHIDIDRISKEEIVPNSLKGSTRTFNT